MKELQKILNKLDINFLSLKKVEKIVVYLLIVLVLGALINFVVLPMNSKKITILKAKVNTLENALKNNKRALKNNEEQKILLKEVERSNESIKEEIKNNKQALEYIGLKIQQQHNIKFSSEQWGIFFKDIQKKANKHKIKLTSINNRELVLKIPDNIKPEDKKKIMDKKRKEFRPIFTLSLDANANFRNLMNFLVDIEKNKLITKINTLRIQANNEKLLKVFIEINLWGIK